MFFLFALSYALSDKFVDGRRIGTITNKVLVKPNGTIRTIEVIISTLYSLFFFFPIAIYTYIYFNFEAYLWFIKSLQGEDGDIIDCVDIYQQPAFDHPFLKNHTIQVFYT